MKRQQRQFRIFSRTWWRMEGGKRVHGAGRKTTLGYRDTAEEARQFCKEWNASHDPGPLSRKAEFTEE